MTLLITGSSWVQRCLLQLPVSTECGTDTKEPLTQDLPSPSAERIRPQESGPEDQHRDEGLEVGGHQAVKSKAGGSRFLPGSQGHQGLDSVQRSPCFSFFPCPCDPALFSFLCPFDEGRVFLVHHLWRPGERVLVRATISPHWKCHYLSH